MAFFFNIGGKFGEGELVVRRGFLDEDFNAIEKFFYGDLICGMGVVFEGVEKVLFDKMTENVWHGK